MTINARNLARLALAGACFFGAAQLTVSGLMYARLATK